MRQSQINILVILANLGMGGIERHLSYLFQHSDKRLFKFHVITLKKYGQLIQIAKNEGIPIYDLNIEKTYTPKALCKAINFRKVLLNERIHIINAYQFKESLFAFFLKLLCWKTILITGRRDWRTKSKKTYIIAYRIINQVTNKIVAVAEAVKEKTIKMESLKSDKALTIYNGVDTIKFSKSKEHRKIIRLEFNIFEGEIVIGTVANLKPTKGYPTLLRAFREIIKYYKNVTWMITGKWLKESRNLKWEIEEALIQYKIEQKVIFTGPRDDIPAILNAHDLFVLPSYDEGFSNSILEAMSCGKPVVTTDVGGNCEVIENMKDGIIVPPGNVLELVKAVKYLIDRPEESKKIGVLARKKVLSKFSVEKMVKNWSHFYENVYKEKYLALK